MAVVRFDLHQLGWRAFQQLCHTVLREVLDQTVESFLDTNDGGRDGAFGGTWLTGPAGTPVSGSFVVQCKHTARREHNLASSDLSDEYSKAQRLAAAGRCDVYVLMTNAGVSGSAEEMIVRDLKSRGVRHVLVLGSSWFDETISSRPRLRRLVPRLYGLGDLTQILDERSYEQARAVLDAMRADLDRLVLTGTYVGAARSLDEHRFVLLVGAPATGKTTIAAQLALGAADEYDTAVVKLERIRDLKDRWNPNEPQLFWLDDAFGAQQFDSSAARDWVTAIPALQGAVHAKSRFVLTTRDYIYRAARDHLKVSAFPLLLESEVVVDVAALTSDEREQILYNHLRHGRQPKQFVEEVRPHLEFAASHAGFTPELARRLSEPVFTAQVRPWSRESVDGFLSRPADFLHDVLVGLDTDSKAALGLVFVNRGWLASPIEPTERDADLLSRLGSNLGSVTSALGALDGSLVNNLARDGDYGWTFAHPTMADAYGRLLQTPEFFHHFVAGFPIDVLLSTVSCGDVGIEGAIVLPAPAWRELLVRLEEPVAALSLDERFRERDRRDDFLAQRCCQEFLTQWLEDDPERLGRFRHAGLMIEAASSNGVAARLHEFGLLPDDIRNRFAADLMEYGATGIDPAALWSPVGSLLTDTERGRLLTQVRADLLGRPDWAIARCTEGARLEDDGDAEAAVSPLRDLVVRAEDLYPDDPSVAQAAQRLDTLIDQWVDENSRYDEGEDDRPDRAPSSLPPLLPSVERSTFDDILDGRETGT